MQTLQDRDPEILFSILALALRFRDDDVDVLGTNVACHVEAARTRVSRRISEGKVELSTIQTLCLLTLVDFAGKTMLLQYLVPHLIGFRWQDTTSKLSLQPGYEPSPQRRLNI